MNISQINDLIKVKAHYENLSIDEKETINTLFNTYKFLIFNSDKQIENVNKILETLK